MPDTSRLISLNVKGISNFQKRRMIFTWCPKKSVDIIFLQETHSKKETEFQWRNEWGTEIMSHRSSNSHGVAILFKRGVDCTIQTKILDPLGRFIILKAEIRDTVYVLNINIYAPNKDKEIVKFFNELMTVLQKENLDKKRWSFN